MSVLKFTKTHEWAKIDAQTAVVGITDYAQKSLGDIVFVELPKAGSVILQGKRFGTIESTKAASELYAPLGGEVIEINKELVNNPQWINESAFEKGWMFKVKLADVSQINSLLDENAYEELVAKEAH
ncbi:MAG: glycine cleavage system protein GcvH [Candidatus Omnitrophota bacterium]